MEARDVELLS